MSTFKCKMCGGTLEIQENASVAVCEYCGTKQTLPKLSDDRRANLYDRANHFRRNNDFDKAMDIYEQILNDDPTDAEAYWSIVLCRYGIEYVEDPTSRRRIPTINRAQFTSVFDDVNYKSALQHADGLQRSIYEDEAKTINEIQRGILAISQKEEPFDVFICYKETDNGGRRTPDSVLATELYHELTREGFKVFFSRITLEDKLGIAYEPYIFAALNSAKVMVVLGTRQEYFNAVWVKNEWSRYLALIKNGARKILIPAYRDMDPYDLPEEFAHLQAQDMSKLGFMQDLLRGIKKIVEAEAPKLSAKETVVVQQSAPAYGGNIGALLERGNMALEDGDWNKADGFFEEVLNQDAKNADAYLGKTLAEERCATLSAFVQKRLNMTGSAEYEKFSLPTNPERAKAAAEKYFIPRYLSKETITGFYANKPGYANCITSRKAQKADEERYWSEHKQLSRAMRFASGDGAQNIKAAYAGLMEKLDERIREAEAESDRYKVGGEKAYADFLDTTDVKAEKAYEGALRKREADYQELCVKMGKDNDAPSFERIAQEFKTLFDYKDSKERVEICRDRAKAWLVEQEAEKERQRVIDERNAAIKRAKTKKISIVASITLVVVVIVATLLASKVIIPNSKYNNAVALMESGQYEAAIAAFEAMEGYEDSSDLIVECKYQAAHDLFGSSQFSAAFAKFNELGNYKDSTNLAIECQYQDAIKSFNNSKFEEARKSFEALGDYKDSKDMLEQSRLGSVYAQALSAEKSNLKNAYNFYSELPADFRDVSERKSLIESLMACEGTYTGTYKNGSFSEDVVITLSFTLDGDTIKVKGTNNYFYTTESGFPSDTIVEKSTRAGFDYRIVFKYEYESSISAKVYLYINENTLAQYYQDEHLNFTLTK